MNHVAVVHTRSVHPPPRVPRSSLCPPSAVDNTQRRKRREKKKGTQSSSNATPRSRRGASDPQAHRRIASGACGAAYGAWLPIVKTAAYLTDFTVDRIFRMNPGWPPGSRGMCARCHGTTWPIVDHRVARYSDPA